MQKAREKHLALLINSNFPLNVYACVFLMGKKKTKPKTNFFQMLSLQYRKQTIPF